MNALNLSYYAIKLYNHCPKKWWFVYHSGEKAKKVNIRVALEGSIWHALQEAWVKAGCPQDVNWMLSRIDSELKKFEAENVVTYRSSMDKLFARAKIESIITKAWNWLVPLIGRPMHPEYKLKAEVEPGLYATGRADLVLEDPLEVMDYKGVEHIRTLDPGQLEFYDFIVTKMFGMPPSRLYFLAPLTPEAKIEVKTGAASKDRVVESVQSVAKGIRANQFEARPSSKCNDCGFQDMCGDYQTFRKSLAAKVSRAIKRRDSSSGSIRIKI